MPDQGRSNAQMGLDYRTRLCIRAPMRDGVELSAVLVLPIGDGPFPTIFRLTPYIADSFLPDGAVFAARGYAYLCADARGRGESGGGPYRQLVHDRNDGVDCIEWIARQPWSDGNVVLYGSSYSGTNQWIIASAAPEPLKAMSPNGVSLLGYDYPLLGGILPAYIFQMLTLTAGRALHANALADGANWNAMLGQVWRENRRLTALSELSGNPAPMFHEMAASGTALEPFTSCLLDENDYARIRIPVFSSTGVADITCPGTIEAHRRFLAVANQNLAAKSRLVLGPWEHLGLETGSDQVGSIQLGPASNLDVRQLKLDWFDWILGRGPEPEKAREPVLLYRAGQERWMSGASLNSFAGEHHSLSLGHDGSLRDNTDTSHGHVSGPAAHRNSFICDPNDDSLILPELEVREAPTPTKKNAPSIRVGPSYNDLSTVLAGADPANDVFVATMGRGGIAYHGLPLAKSLTLAGHPSVKLWLRLNVPDVDLAILLSAILPDGQAIMLSGDIIRLRHRNGIDREELAKPGVPLLLERPRMRYVSRTLPAGSRLRLVVRNGTSIRLEKNLHAAKPVRLQRPSEAVTATVEVLCGGEYPSTIDLPGTR